MDNKLAIILSAKDETRAAFASANKSLEALSSRAASVATTFKSVAGVVAAGFGVSSFAGLIKSSIDAQDNLKDLSKATGVSIRDLAGLGSAAAKSGSDLEAIAQSINKLSVNMAKDPAKFKAIGVTAKEPIDALKQLSDVFVSIEDPQKRAAFAAEALGKSWQGVAPLLAEGGDSIGQMVDRGRDLSKITEESAAKADELNDKLVELKSAGTGVATEFSNLLVPSLTETAKKMVEMTDKGHPLLALLQGLAGLGKLPFDLAFGSVDMSVTGQIKDLKASLEDLQAKRESYNPFRPWGDSLKEIDQKIIVTKNQIAALERFGGILDKKKVEAPVARVPGLYSPGSGFTSDIDIDRFIGRDKPQKTGGGKAPSEKVAELTASTKDYQAAMESLNNAMISAESSTLHLDAAQEALHKLMSGAEWETYSKAMQWSAIEQASFASGAISAADAQKRLNDLMADTPTAALEKAQADAKLLEEALSKAGNAADYKKIKEALDGVYAGAAKSSEKFSEMSEYAKRAAQSMQSSFADFLYDPFSDGMDGMLAKFGDTVRRMAADATAAKLSEALFGDLLKGNGGGGMGIVGDWFSGLFGNADGGVYASPSLSKYSGGVYNSPQFFKFASGAGVFGEAGPEAIMPLKRGSDGKLGVAASGGGSNVTVNVINNAAGVQATQSKRRDESGNTVIDVLLEQIDSVIGSNISRGTGKVASAIENAYGLNRVAGAH